MVLASRNCAPIFLTIFSLSTKSLKLDETEVNADAVYKFSSTKTINSGTGMFLETWSFDSRAPLEIPLWTDGEILALSSRFSRARQ